MGDPRELLIELIGEEETAKYFEGLAIELEGKNHNYTIKRKNGYADLVRTTSQESYNYHGNYYSAISLIAAGIDCSGLEKGIQYTEKDTGKLRAWNIDDAVVSFIASAKAGQVNWMCGNIDVRLPSAMPPQNLSPLTFLLRGLKTIVHYLMVLPSEYVETLKGDFPSNVMICFTIPSLMLFPFFARTRASTVLAIGFVLFSNAFGFLVGGYYHWKNKWEVKMS